MGVIKGNFLLRVSGKVGDKSYRDFRDKIVVASLPKRDKNDHPNCAAPKKRFGHTSPLASYVNKIPALQKLWQVAGSSSFSAFHSLMRSNTNASSTGHLTIKNIISPPGKSLKVSEVIISGGTLKAQFEIIGGLIPPPFQALLIIYAYSPVGENKNYRFYNITTQVTGCDESEKFNLVFNPYPLTLNWISNYKKWIMYFTLIKDDDSAPLTWTSTAACESSPDSASFCEEDFANSPSLTL